MEPTHTNPILTLISVLTEIGTLIGLFLLIYSAIKEKLYKKALFIILIPFYAIKYILSMKESQFKKYVTVLYLGGFFTFLFINILIFIMTPRY